MKKEIEEMLEKELIWYPILKEWVKRGERYATKESFSRDI